MPSCFLSFFIILLCSLPGILTADELSPQQKKILNEEIERAKQLASNPRIVSITEGYNSQKPEENAKMTEEQWKNTTNRESIVINLKTNEAARIMEASKDQAVSEAFLSGADGTKIAFLAKTTSWCHKGKPKHDEPMKGGTWIGSPEFDKSVAKQQVQFSIPILKGDKPIGSLVIGVAL